MPSSKDKRHPESASKIRQWLESITDRQGAKTTLVVGGDINSDFGLGRDERGRLGPTKGAVVGGIRPKAENENGKEMREYCLGSDMAIATTWHDIGCTYHAQNGATARIDHIAIPRQAVQLIKRCWALRA